MVCHLGGTGVTCRVCVDGDGPMAKEDDYRRYAAETIDLASRANSTSDKGRLLAMAEAWLDLADRAHRLASPSVAFGSRAVEPSLSRLSRSASDKFSEKTCGYEPCAPSGGAGDSGSACPYRMEQIGNIC